MRAPRYAGRIAIAAVAALTAAGVGRMPRAAAQSASTPPTAPAAPSSAALGPEAPETLPSPDSALPLPPSTARDTVLLKDGTRVEGTIVSQEPGRYVILQTSAGLQTIAWDEIRRVTQASRTAVPPPAAAAPPPIGPPPAVTLAPEDADVQWRRRRGSRFVLDLHGQGSWNHKAYKGTSSNNDVSAGGGGGGGGIYGGWLFGGAPRPSSGNGRWSGFEVGSGVDVSSVWFYNTQSIQPGVKEVLMQMIFPFVVGGRFGFGSFKSDTNWSGVALGVAWSPQYAWYSNDAAHADSGGFSPLGAELSVDVVSMHADANGKGVRFFYRQTYGLGSIPHTGTLGIGPVWY